MEAALLGLPGSPTGLSLRMWAGLLARVTEVTGPHASHHVAAVVGIPGAESRVSREPGLFKSLPWSTRYTSYLPKQVTWPRQKSVWEGLLRVTG